MIRKHILFFGEVQGVGFRYHSYYKARSLGLTGWVLNRYDGSVEMEVQGSREDIDALILHLKAQNYIYIESMQMKTIPVIEERSFERID
ncbi:MAG: acylphosphatase [Ruminococcaceae bacterium]|nr:acylphosphatase [Oscillospiraceae bacterium]